MPQCLQAVIGPWTLRKMSPCPRIEYGLMDVLTSPTMVEPSRPVQSQPTADGVFQDMQEPCCKLDGLVRNSWSAFTPTNRSSKTKGPQ